MASNPLSPSSLLQIIEGSLEASSAPSQGAAEEAATRNAQEQRLTGLRNPYDAIAILVHACMLAVGFRLIGLGEEDRIDPPIDITIAPQKPLPLSWNTSSGTYSFRYAHSQSSLEFLIKLNRLGTKAVIFGLATGDDKTTSFDILTRDFTSESFFPYTPAIPGPDEQAELESGGARKRLRDGYISESRIADFAGLFKINIIQKLIPGLNKAGYQEEASAGAESMTATRGLRRQPSPPIHDPLRVPFPPARPYAPLRPPPIPAGEVPPGFEDEYEILQRPRAHPHPYGGRNPLSIGEDDLNPPGLGPNPPLRGPFFGEGGIPRPGFGGMGPMGGMHPAPDHPMFGGGNGHDEYDPRFPPGSRYDPIGPGDAPRGGLRGPRGPGWGGGGGSPFESGGGFGGFGGGDFI
ncbi:PI31 proteasome regulator N-terminal-domain-containing protein [Kalaharituber pfeilii]|nr:PI31 proteasome regulator N-terminal-domain-containing protein [Kalaharituber pfeilii]